MRSILTRFLVLTARKHVDDFDFHYGEIMRSTSPAIVYPDGALEINPSPDNLAHWRAITDWKTHPIPFANFGVFAALPPFQPDGQRLSFRVFSTKEHERRTSPGGVAVSPGANDPSYRENMDLSEVEVSLIFRGPVEVGDAVLAASSLRGWFDRTGDLRVCGEGAI